MCQQILIRPCSVPTCPEEQARALLEPPPVPGAAVRAWWDWEPQRGRAWWGWGH